MDINRIETKMGEIKWLVLQVIPLSMATVANKFSTGMEAATLVAALCTATLLGLAQWHKYRLARRKDLHDKRDYEAHRQDIN